MGVLGGFKAKMVIDCLEQKLGIDFRQGREQNGWYCIGQDKILRVTVPKEHGGGHDSLTKGVARKVINQLRLTNYEFLDLYNCPMSGADYRKKIDDLRSQQLL